jgi:hypothetical protein
MESDAYPFTPKTYPNDKGDTIDIGPLPLARNGQVAAPVDCLDGSMPLCKAQRKSPQFGQQFTQQVFDPENCLQSSRLRGRYDDVQ